MVVRKGRKAIYLSPLVALANELGISWRAEFSEAQLGVYTGERGGDDSRDNPSPSEASVLIMTPEKLDFYVRQWSGALEWLADVDLVVADELHTLDGGRRGATLEGAITRLMCINPYVRVMGLSATMGNPEALAQWVGGESFVSNERPIPLQWSIRSFKNSEDKVGLTLEEIDLTTAQGGQVIVFVQSRPRAESLAQRIQAAGFTCNAHHAGLSKAAREKTEASFRARKLDAIVATGTLSVGINMPVRRVVIFDLARWEGDGFKDLSTNECWQLAGRAGRRGLDTVGEVTLLAPKWNQKAARRVMEGKFEPIKSALEQEGPWFYEQVLATIGSRIAITPDQTARVLGRSFWGSAQTLKSVAARVERGIDKMMEARMLEASEKGYLRATKLGRIAVRFQLSPETVLAWSRVSEVLPNATLMDLLMLVCASRDFTSRVRLDSAEVEAVGERLRKEPVHLGALPSDVRKELLPASGQLLASAAKTSLALRAWTRLGNEEEAAVYVGCVGHEVDAARKEAVRLGQAMLAVLEGDVPKRLKCEATASGMTDEVGVAERLRALIAMVCAGLDHEAATLALVDGIGPVMSRRLMEFGVENIEDLALEDAARLCEMGGLSAKRAGQWISEAGELLAHGGAHRYREITRDVDAGQALGEGKYHAGLDANRWERAKQLLVVEGFDGWTVAGGSEPHTVVLQGGELRCDCQDAQKGRLCKHRIAVLEHQGDPRIPSFKGGYPDWHGATLLLTSGTAARSTR